MTARKPTAFTNGYLWRLKYLVVDVRERRFAPGIESPPFPN